MRSRRQRSDQDADGNLDCENREDDHDDQQRSHEFAPQRSSHANLLVSIASQDRVLLAFARLSVWCSGLEARLHLAAVVKVDRRIEDHLISRLYPAVHFHPRAQIAA
jgi:hypothetical protein